MQIQMVSSLLSLVVRLFRKNVGETKLRNVNSFAVSAIVSITNVPEVSVNPLVGGSSPSGPTRIGVIMDIQRPATIQAARRIKMIFIAWTILGLAVLGLIMLP